MLQQEVCLYVTDMKTELHDFALNVNQQANN